MRHERVVERRGTQRHRSNHRHNTTKNHPLACQHVPYSSGDHPRLRSLPSCTYATGHQRPDRRVWDDSSVYTPGMTGRRVYHAGMGKKRIPERDGNPLPRRYRRDSAPAPRDSGCVPQGSDVRPTTYTGGTSSTWGRAMTTARRPRVAWPALAGDTLLTFLAVLYASLHILVTGRHGPGQESQGWAIALAALCASALLVRSRWPLATLVGVGFFGALYMLVVNDVFPILPAVLIAM